MVYLALLGAIAMEVTGTTMLKYSEGFSKILPAVISLLCYSVSFLIVSKVMLRLDMGITYATWGAVGIVATSIIGVVVFKEGLTTIGMVSIVLIVVGVVLLNLYGKA